MLPTKERPFCKCGCGKRVTKIGNKWIKGHDKRGKNNPMKNPEIAKKASNSHKKRCDDPKVREEMSKRFLQYNKDHPEKSKAQSERMKEHCKDTEVLKAMSERTIKQFSTQEARDAQAERMAQWHKDHPEFSIQHSKWLIQFYIDHPEGREAARLKTIEQFSDPAMREAARLKTIEQFSTQEAKDIVSDQSTKYWSNQINRDALSEIMINSDAARKWQEEMIGGNDLCWHHVAYDFDDPDTLRVRLTRKFHSSIHHPKGIQFSIHGYSLID
jgi:hypothetical protein